MKIFVVGATGRVASELVKDLVAKGHQVTAAARHPENVLLKDSPQVTAVKLDLHASKEELAALIGQQDAIYFTAGSRGKDLLQTDASCSGFEKSSPLVKTVIFIFAGCQLYV